MTHKAHFFICIDRHAHFDGIDKEILIESDLVHCYLIFEKKSKILIEYSHEFVGEPANLMNLQPNLQFFESKCSLLGSYESPVK